MTLSGPDSEFNAFLDPLSDLSNVSPMGLDMGPFMGGIEWEI